MVTGETISHWMWNGPDPHATTFFSAATALTGVAQQIAGILGEQQASAAALLTAWASPTGEQAVAANSPYGVWLTEAQAQLTTAANHIQLAGTAFNTAKFATPPPAAFNAINIQYAQLLPFALLPGVAVILAWNRTVHAAMTMAAHAAYTGWGTASSGMVGALSALTTSMTAPPSATVPGVGSSISAAAAQLPMATGLASPLPSVGSSVGSATSSVGSSVGSATSLLSQPTDALASSGGQLAQAPASAASGLGSMASAPMSSGLGSPTAGSAGSGGVNDGNWLSATAGGGTVAAALSGGGAGGFGGLSGAGAMAAMRGPGSWGSAVNAASPAAEADQVMVSRITEAKAASAMPSTAGGMGVPGAMAPGARQESERERGLSDPLAAAAVLYRPPRGMPVVTGATGAQFVAGEEDE